MKTCKKCGTMCADNARYCTECGEVFPEIISKETSGNMGLHDAASNGGSTTPANFSPDGGDSSIAAKKPSNNKKKKLLLIVLLSLIAMTTVVVAIVLTRPKLVGLQVKYLGSFGAGNVIDDDEKNFDVVAVYSDGNTKEVTDWTLNKPVELKPDKEAKVTITYKKLSKDVTIKCSTSLVASLDVSYEGKTDAGIVLEEKNTDIVVTAVYVNGDRKQIPQGGWRTVNVATLEPEKESTITISYTDRYTGKPVTAPLKVKCTTTLSGITAEYSGDTLAGTSLDTDNDGITVTASYSDGSTQAVTGWTVKSAVELKAGETSTVEIDYEGKSCQLQVKCTSLTKEQYKASCQSIPYDDIARNPDKNEGAHVKYYGRVAQVTTDPYGLGMVDLRVYITNKDGYGYYDDQIWVEYLLPSNAPKILEDDMITFYGTYEGITSYQALFGNTITVPKVNATYIDRE